MIDLGDLVPLTVTVRDAAGAATNASTVTLTIELPDGTTVSPTVTNPPVVTGVYAYDYLPVQVGRHVYRFVSTGPQSAYSDVFDVRAAFPAYIISLADARQILKLQGSADDEDLRGVIEATTRVIERHTGRAMARRVVTEYHRADSYGCSDVWLNKKPVLSLTSITTRDLVTSWDVLGVDSDLDMGRLTLRSGYFRGDLAVTYVAGYTEIPAEYTHAAEVIVQHLWKSRRADRGAPRMAGLDTPGEGFTTYGSDLPVLVRTLLGPPPPMVA